MEPTLNTWTTIFLLASGQGVFLSVVILFRKDKDPIPKRLLSAIILGFTLILLFCVAYWTRYTIYLPKGTSSILNLTYMIGPLMLYYVSQFSEFKRPIKHFPFHLIPFGIVMSIMIIHWNSEEQIIANNVFIVFTAIQNIHLLIYSVLVVHDALKLNSNKWVRHVSFAYSGYAVSFFSYYLMSWTGILQIEYDYMISVMMSIFIYFVGYYSYSHQNQLFGLGKKYLNSGLSQSASLVLYNKVIDHINSQERFLDSSVKLRELSIELGLSTHLVSQVINRHSGKSLSDMLNELRVNKAIELMSTPRYYEDKLISIAYDSGFNNKASFNNAFKKFTGKPPSVYRREHCPPESMEVA